MAPKLRVYNLARELNLDNAEIIRELQHMGVPVTSHSNTVDDRQAALLRKKFAVVAEAPKPAPEVVASKASKAEPVVEHVEPTPQVEAKAEAKIEVKPEPHAATPAPQSGIVAEPKTPSVAAPTPPAATVAPPPPAPPVAPRPPVVEQKAPPPPVQRPAPRGVQFVEPKAHVSPIVTPPPERKTPSPSKVEPPHEERKTMQQIVQEKLRRENRLPPTPAPRKPGIVQRCPHAPR